MKFEPQVKNIDGESYTFNLLSADEALDIFERVMKLVGPAAFEGIARLEKLPDLETLSQDDMAMLGPIARVLFGSFARGEVSGLVKDLCKPVLVNDVPLARVFAAHFQGRIGTALRVALMSLQVNFSDFFGGLGGLLARAKAVPAKSNP